MHTKVVLLLQFYARRLNAHTHTQHTHTHSYTHTHTHTHTLPKLKFALTYNANVAAKDVVQCLSVTQQFPDLTSHPNKVHNTNKQVNYLHTHSYSLLYTHYMYIHLQRFGMQILDPLTTLLYANI